MSELPGKEKYQVASGDRLCWLACNHVYSFHYSVETWVWQLCRSVEETKQYNQFGSSCPGYARHHKYAFKYSNVILHTVHCHYY